MCQPARCNLDDYSDTVRIALVDGESVHEDNRAVLCFQDCRVFIEPSIQPALLYPTLITESDSVRFTRDARGSHLTASANQRVSFAVQVLDEDGALCDVDGILKIDKEQFDLNGGRGSVDLQVAADARGEVPKEVIFIPTNAMSDTELKTTIFVTISIGPPKFILPDRSQIT